MLALAGVILILLLPLMFFSALAGGIVIVLLGRNAELFLLFSKKTVYNTIKEVIFMNIKRIFKRKQGSRTRDLQKFFNEFEVVKVPIGKKFSAKNNYELLRSGEHTGVFSVEKRVLEAHVPELAGLVAAQMKDEAESYGRSLAFYACGNNWKKQLKFRNHYEDLGINLL